MTKQTEKPVNRRGHNAMVTGLAILVFGLILTVASTGGMQGLGIFVAVAGLVTGIIGIGMRRER